MDIALDTNAYSNYLSGFTGILDVISKSHKIYLPVIVIGELLSGYKTGSRESVNLEYLTTFISKSSVEIINNLTLVTFDQHFTRIDRLKLLLL